jgi:hypothetical protein
MHNGKYVSIKTILYDIARYPFVEGIQPEDIALYLNNLLALVGSPFAFEKKYKVITITDYRGALPCDLVRIDGTKYIDATAVDVGWRHLKYASNIYHSDILDNDCPDKTCTSDESYSINNGLIYTSFKDGELNMAYQGIATDEEGFPMIPDSAAFKQALKYYVLLQYAEPARYRGNVPRDVYEDISKQYAWYVGAASNDLNMLSMDKAKSLENGIIRLFQSHDFHSEGWSTFNKKEKFRQ